MNPTSAHSAADASTVLAYILQETGAEAAEALLPGAAITTDTLTEVVQHALRHGYLGTPTTLAQDLMAIGLQVVTTTTVAQAARAAELLQLCRAERDQHGNRTLARGDAQVLALAEHLGVPAVTGDRLWVEYQHLLTVPVKLFR
ncbi:PIN domain-containing protein [Kitasatospora sp. NPDC057542]|uniref:PIN domain-containing protein n=1 Tax=Kitasatospora sp. NPDC057542 TaxID=3346162 RepID=UPI00367BFE7D